MTIRLLDGRILSGTPLQIVKQMMVLAWDCGDSIADYLDATVARIQETHDQPIKIVGTTDDEMAASLISELVHAGLAQAIHGSHL
jgi:hypothetical protein